MNTSRIFLSLTVISIMSYCPKIKAMELNQSQPKKTIAESNNHKLFEKAQELVEELKKTNMGTCKADSEFNLIKAFLNSYSTKEKDRQLELQTNTRIRKFYDSTATALLDFLNKEEIKEQSIILYEKNKKRSKENTTSISITTILENFQPYSKNLQEIQGLIEKNRIEASGDDKKQLTCIENLYKELICLKTVLYLNRHATQMDSKKDNKSTLNTLLERITALSLIDSNNK